MNEIKNLLNKVRASVNFFIDWLGWALWVVLVVLLIQSVLGMAGWGKIPLLPTVSLTTLVYACGCVWLLKLK